MVLGCVESHHLKITDWNLMVSSSFEGPSPVVQQYKELYKQNCYKL